MIFYGFFVGFFVLLVFGMDVYIFEEWCFLFYFISFIFIIFSYNFVFFSDLFYVVWVICFLIKLKIYVKNIRKNEL